MFTAASRIDKVPARIYNVVGLLTNKIDLSPLTGARRSLSVTETVELPPFGALVFPSPIAVDLDIERAGSTLMVVGTINVDAQGECDRCLAGFEMHRVYDVDERFVIGSNADPFDESNVVHDDQLDLGDFIRQIVDAALPLTQLCKEDCAGLCVTCGSNLNEGTCDCGDLTKGDHG